MDAPVSRAPALRHDTVGAFESRLRRHARWRWIAPIAALALAAGWGVTWWLGQRGPVEVSGSAARAGALVLAQRDDPASLAGAAAQLQEVIRTAAQPEAAMADEALVELLRLDPAGRAGGSGPEAIARIVAPLARAEVQARAASEVARALAVAAALRGSRDEVRRQVSTARARIADDPWAALAEVWVDARSSDRTTRDRAIGALSILTERRPELLRARWVLAQALAQAGRGAEARAALQPLLARNPAHAGARALQADLDRPPPQAPVPNPAPAASPAPAVSAAPAASAPPAAAAPPAPRQEGTSTSTEENGAVPPRKPVAQPTEPSATPHAGEPAPRPAPTVAHRGAESEEPAAPAEAPAASATPAPTPEEPASPPRPARLRPAAVPPPEPITIEE